MGEFIPHLVIHFIDVVFDRKLFAAHRAAKDHLASADVQLYFLSANLAFYAFHTLPGALIKGHEASNMEFMVFPLLSARHPLRFSSFHHIEFDRQFPELR